MNKDERTVIDRLDDIEKKIPSFSSEEPKPISEIIGMPFADYLNSAVLYGYEDDIRKFKRTIKKHRTMPFILLSIFVPILIFAIVSLIINKHLEWLLVIATLFALVSPVLTLVILSKQKNKQPMHSFWNIKNIEFYLANEGDHKKIVKEESFGAIFYILLGLKIISIIVSFAGITWYLLVPKQTNSNSALYWAVYFLGYITLLCNLADFKLRNPYYYLQYIIEAEDSYVTYPDLNYFKK